MATRKKKEKLEAVSESWPKVTQGSHLTVTENEDGSVDMAWDDEALARDVRNAIASLDQPKQKKKK